MKQKSECGKLHRGWEVIDFCLLYGDV
jgi:hypothetical protein